MGKRLTAFIGREEELALIDQMVNEWNTLRIFCIYGPGGIGKTRLLQEVKKRYQRQKSVTIPDIIDFASSSNIIPFCPEQLGGLPTPRPSAIIEYSKK